MWHDVLHVGMSSYFDALLNHNQLVARRKFDIRQWVMVTCWNPLTVWFFEDAYVRLCVEVRG